MGMSDNLFEKISIEEGLDEPLEAEFRRSPTGGYESVTPSRPITVEEAQLLLREIRRITEESSEDDDFPY